ncbi:M1 family metallopeptidase [Acidianus brierleyi]|uniref:Aminopeptidase n=1 Tax=Acidianus brierleyi TaxID=41673 RepID=A0A2U9IBX3_9CREN|nr:M1 family metallopeptidase [Acidianus brierleyi]AWR93512.1 leucyl aminopeptidase [Acidianus brierleyi]
MEVKYYQVFLDFDFNELYYRGNEKIIINTEDKVTLDLDGIKILSVKVDGKTVKYTLDDQSLIIDSGKFSGTLDIDFEGKVRDDLVGIYKAPYNGSYIITTQFESTHARKFIPCVDNPSYKAEFKLIVKVDKDLDVISNMPIERITNEGSKKTVEFYKTPKMSTYLLYLGIGKFEEYQLGETPKIIVATVPGKISKSKIPADYALRFIRFYENYFGIKYVMPKVHLIAVPEFAFGAMENWGAITFRETALLADENSAFKQIRRVAEVVAHELAHQWFGDLVTMKWWNDLWLNESFATFMSYKAVDSNFSDWDFWGEFISEETSGAMLKDSLHITHPIEVEVKSPSEIEQIFDDISYGKGASILRMIEAYLGKEDFQKGIRDYLEAHKFGNAEGKDLWQSLEVASGKPVSRIMPEWVTKEGYPIVFVKTNGNSIELSQKRFMLSGLEDKVYPIPLTIEINGKKESILLDKDKDIINFGEDIKSLKLNLDRTGMYRVYYDNLDLFWNSNPNHFERFGLVNDYFNLLLSGNIQVNDYFKIINHEMNEQNYLPAMEISDQLFTLYQINSDKYRKIAYDFHSSMVQKFENAKSSLDKLAFGTIAERFIKISDEYARKISEEFYNYDKLDPDIKDAVVEAYAIVKEDESLDTLLEKYRKEKFDEDRMRYLKALLSYKKSYLVVNNLSLALTGEIKKQDVITVISNSIVYPEVRYAVWTWLKTNIQFIARIYQGTGILGRVMSNVIPILGLGRETQVEDFFSKNKVSGAEKGILQGLEILKAYSKLA